MRKLEISQFSDPARGGRRVEVLTSSRRTTVLWPGGVRSVTISENWKDIGTLMEPITNHVPEQPTSYAAKLVAAHVKAQKEQFLGG